MQEYDRKGQVAVLTGAGGGIGRAIAEKLAQQGMTLVLLGGTRPEKLEETKAAVAELTHVSVMPGDLTDTAFLTQAAEEITARFGAVNVLINNAGMALNAPFTKVTEDQFDRIMAINVKAPYFLTQALLPSLKRAEGATVVNMASVNAHEGYPDQSAYAASKHALLGFTKSLARECYKDGVRVHAVCPGSVYTDMIKVARPDLTGEGMISAEEIADLVWFLLSHRGNAVIDEVLVHRVNKEPFLV